MSQTTELIREAVAQWRVLQLTLDSALIEIAAKAFKTKQFHKLARPGANGITEWRVRAALVSAIETVDARNEPVDPDAFCRVKFMAVLLGRWPEVMELAADATRPALLVEVEVELLKTGCYTAPRFSDFRRCVYCEGDGPEAGERPWPALPGDCENVDEEVVDAGIVPDPGETPR